MKSRAIVIFIATVSSSIVTVKTAKLWALILCEEHFIVKYINEQLCRSRNHSYCEYLMSGLLAQICTSSLTLRKLPAHSWIWLVLIFSSRTVALWWNLRLMKMHLFPQATLISTRWWIDEAGPAGEKVPSSTKGVISLSHDLHVHDSKGKAVPN